MEGVEKEIGDMVLVLGIAVPIGFGGSTSQ